jgi:hypothetical protein
MVPDRHRLGRGLHAGGHAIGAFATVLKRPGAGALEKQDMISTRRRRKPRPSYLSERGVALLFAAAVAAAMLAMMLVAFGGARSRSVTLKPIPCPAEWAGRGATCWKAH